MTLDSRWTAWIVETAGWVGAGLVLAAYLLVSTGRVGVRSAMSHWLNMIGTAGLALVSAWHAAWPAAWLDGIWSLIGLCTLFGIARRGGTVQAR